MRDDAHFHAHDVQQSAGSQLPWLLALTAVMVFDVLALAGFFR
jgi:hypothetical protein